MAAGSGGKIVKRADMPDELKLAFFNAGLTPQGIVMVQAPEPEPMDPAVERIWVAFGRFLVEQGWNPDHAGEHISWLIGKEFTPDEWLGKDGEGFRRVHGLRQPSPTIVSAWASFDKEAAADAGWPT